MASRAGERLMRVLDAVVESYIRCGLPVGSRYVSHNFNIGLRASSIRNIFAELEGLGLLAKPHVSAGRVPTEKAFRSYLTRLDGVAQIGEPETRAIDEAMDPNLGVEDLLEKISRLLGRLSDHIGVAVGPGSCEGVISRIETVCAARDRFTVTVTMESGARHTLTLVPDSEAWLERAEAEVGLIGGMIVGKKIEEARRAMRALRLSQEGSHVKFDGLWAALEGLLRDRTRGIHLSGTGNVVPRFPVQGGLKSFLEMLESKETVAELLISGSAGAGSRVTFGSETSFGPLRGCSIICSSYRIGGSAGALGIIGPVRMEYPRLMAILELTSNQLSRLFAGRGGDAGSAAKRKKR
jgi:heat-inducible transcriptional repressor